MVWLNDGEKMSKISLFVTVDVTNLSQLARPATAAGNGTK